MLSEALAALASSGATALVTAMVTEGWESVRMRVGHFLGRGQQEHVAAMLRELDESRESLAGRSGAELEVALSELASAWQMRLADLLDRDRDAQSELRSLVTELAARRTSAVGQLEQHAAAFDHAQQAVQGQGVQNVTFGR